MAGEKYKDHPNKGFLRRVHTIFSVFGGLYLLTVIALLIPFFQSHVLYMNSLKYPFFTKFDVPEAYGLAPRKTHDFTITTSDNVTLGAWFIFSDPFYRTFPYADPDSYASLESRVPLAINSHPTIIFFHGNAATRAAPYRVRYYQAFSSRLSANVLSIDYRGFGNSEGVPSEDGLAKDARAAWDWVVANGADPENILLYGHSLGTAVATRLSAELAAENIAFKGLVLMSPFSSIRKLLETYHFFGFIPLMKPLAMIPGATEFVTSYLVHTFDTLSVIPAIRAPILLAHAKNDWDIPYTHSEVLFNTILEPLLPPLSPSSITSSWSQSEWDTFYTTQMARAKARKSLIKHSEIRHLGTIDEFTKEGEGKVVLLKTNEGGHNKIGSLEGVQEVIRDTFHFD